MVQNCDLEGKKNDLQFKDKVFYKMSKSSKAKVLEAFSMK